MAWIPLHQSVWTHRKTLKLSRMLGINKVVTVAHLAHLWTWAMDNAPDGMIEADACLLVEAAGNPPITDGLEEDFSDALLACGFLDPGDDESCWFIHDWEEYGGKILARNETEKQRIANKREALRNKRATLQKCTQNVAGRLDQIRLDQIREEENRESTSDASQATPSKRATRLPEDWEPSTALLEWKTSNCPNADLTRENLKFRNYWHAKSGKDACKLRWDLTWQNWMTTAEERMPTKNGRQASGGSLQDTAQEEHDAMERMRREGKLDFLNR